MDFSTDVGASSRSGRQGPVVGDFWLRLTVRAQRPWRVGRAGDSSVSLDEWAVAHGFEVAHGVLDRGRTPCRPVLSTSAVGGLDELRRAAVVWAERLGDAGFSVVRTRIEAAPWDDGVPATDAEAASLPRHSHFAHRVTLRLPIPYDTQRLAFVAERHGAHVARDVRRVLSRGVQERVVTQGVRGVGRATARGCLDRLLDELVAEGFRPADAEECLVVDDDNPALDGGWVEEHG
jgi:hypothetical protein